MTASALEETGGTTPAEAAPPWLEELPPRKIVAELDRYIVGQDAAKKAMAIAIRNRWRRSQAPDGIRDEITPYNIILIGPTGVGKTEMARRLARLAGAPFVKVEASKFTEVGYVGRDVESMVRELVDAAISMVRAEREDEVWPQAEQRADERLLDILLPPAPPKPESTGPDKVFVVAPGGAAQPESVDGDASASAPAKSSGRCCSTASSTTARSTSRSRRRTTRCWTCCSSRRGWKGTEINFVEMLQDMMPKKKKRRTVRVPDARRILVDEELKKLVDMDDVVNEALDRTENHGILFIDEIDKIAGERGQGGGPDVSREGVQRDLLPIVEGSTVQTRYGYVRTDHILFIAAGAFHVSKPSDLIPELQGRFPIRVELTPLTEADFVRIMTEPENAIVKQYQALVAAEAATLEFTTDGIAEVARIAALANGRMENIGARRLHTVMATLMEDLLFDLPETSEKRFVFDGPRVRDRLMAIVTDDDLRRYIL